jgi:hypothetical protein
MIKEAAQERLHNIQHITISLTSLDQQHFPDNGTRDSYHFGGLR